MNEMASICMEQLAIISMQVLMTLHCEADYACGIEGGREGAGPVSHFYCTLYVNLAI